MERKPYHFREQLRPEECCAIVDTREQLPLDLSPLRMEVGTLDAGHYSEKSLAHFMRFERKGDDLPVCCGVGRDAFMDQMMRLRGFPVKALILEYSWPQIEMGQWRSKVSPTSVLGTLLGIIEFGIPVIVARSRDRAGKMLARFIFISASRRWRELRGMAENIAGSETPELQGATK